MTERDACALLKARFEKAGFEIAENIPFDEGGVQFEIDGFDADKRVGYEYLTDEAGDSWDVDGTVISALHARREAGELFILVVDEADAPDAEALGAVADLFLTQLDGETEPKRQKKPKPKPAAKKPAARTTKPTKAPKAKAKAKAH